MFFFFLCSSSSYVLLLLIFFFFLCSSSSYVLLLLMFFFFLYSSSPYILLLLIFFFFLYSSSSYVLLLLIFFLVYEKNVYAHLRGLRGARYCIIISVCPSNQMSHAPPLSRSMKNYMFLIGNFVPKMSCKNCYGSHPVFHPPPALITARRVSHRHYNVFFSVYTIKTVIDLWPKQNSFILCYAVLCYFTKLSIKSWLPFATLMIKSFLSAEL